MIPRDRSVWWKDRLQEGWTTKPLKYVVTFNPAVLSESTDEDRGIRYVDIGSVDSIGRIQSIQNCAFADAPSRARRIVAVDDVIVSTVRTYLTAISRIDQDDLIVSTGFAVLRPGPAVDSRFLAYWMRSAFMISEVVARSTGISYPAISALDLAQLPFPSISIAEQRTIADFLDNATALIDALVAAKQSQLLLLREKRQAMIAASLTGTGETSDKLADGRVPWVSSFPAEWKVVRGKFLWREVYDSPLDGDEIVTCFRDGQVTLRRNRREEGFTNAVKELGYQHVKSGQLVLHSMDAFAGAIGVSDSDGKCTPEYIVCEPRTPEVLNPFFGYLLRMMALNGFILANCPAVRERAPRIHFADLANMYIPVPPASDQIRIIRQIENAVTQIDDLIIRIQQTVELLGEQRLGIISRAVMGQIVAGARKLEAAVCL